jgi:hypothetical protein
LGREYLGEGELEGIDLMKSCSQFGVFIPDGSNSNMNQVGFFD